LLMIVRRTGRNFVRSHAARSACPGRPEDHLAKIGALEAGIFEGQNIIIDGTKSAVWPMLHGGSHGRLVV
jgi:hypothetical protein